MKTKIQGSRLALATLLGLAAAGSASAAPGDFYPGWGFGFSGETFVPFNLGGNLDDFATDSVVGEDGSLYMAGTVRDAQGFKRIGIAKLDPDGVLDDTFSFDGINTSQLTNVTATGIALTDTRIYVVGFTTNNAPDFNMVVCQFVRSSGTNVLFPNSNSSCVFPDSLPGTQDIANDIVVQPDGKFVIAGTMAGNVGQEFAAFARFNSDGSRDTTFGTVPGSNIALVRSQGIYDHHRINAITRDGNGDIVGVGSTQLIGDSGESALVIRLDENGTGGTPEFSFTRDGSASRDTVLSDVVAVNDPNNADDALLVAGLVELSAGKNSGFIAKVAANGGALVNTFGEDPGNITAITLAGATNLDFTSLAVEPDGSIVTLGLRSPDGAGDDLLVRRFTDDGGIDTIFGNNGNVIIDFGFAGEFHGTAAIGALGDGLYISGWAAQNPDTSNLDFIAAKLVSGSDPLPGEDFFANGFKDGFED